MTRFSPFPSEVEALRRLTDVVMAADPPKGFDTSSEIGKTGLALSVVGGMVGRLDRGTGFDRQAQGLVDTLYTLACRFGESVPEDLRPRIAEHFREAIRTGLLDEAYRLPEWTEEAPSAQP